MSDVTWLTELHNRSLSHPIPCWNCGDYMTIKHLFDKDMFMVEGERDGKANALVYEVEKMFNLQTITYVFTNHSVAGVTLRCTNSTNSFSM